MPKWNPSREWDGQDAFVIGGGPSLRGFHWPLLEGKNVVGCNTAFTLGPDVCPTVVFGDLIFWERHKRQLMEFKGRVVTNCRQLYNTTANILTMKRERHGLHHNALGWNMNTGASAINLCLILGAKRVFLLGFDFKPDEGGCPNWHKNQIQDLKAGVYGRMLENFEYVKRDLHKFGAEIINLNPSSELKIFPFQRPEEVL